MKNVQTISKDINMNFGLEKCARICLKRGSVQSKMQVGSSFENDIKELDPRKAYKLWDTVGLLNDNLSKTHMLFYFCIVVQSSTFVYRVSYVR